MPTRMVGLGCVLAPLAAPFLRRSASVLHVDRFGARCLDQESVPYRRRQVSHRLMRLEDGLEHDLVETLLLEFAVCFWAWPPLSSSRWLPSVSLFLFAHSVSLDGPLARARVPFCCVLRLGCRTGWAWIVGAGKGRCVKRACAQYVCKSPNSCAQRLQLIGCVTSSSNQVMWLRSALHVPLVHELTWFCVVGRSANVLPQLTH